MTAHEEKRENPPPARAGAPFPQSASAHKTQLNLENEKEDPPLLAPPMANPSPYHDAKKPKPADETPPRQQTKPEKN